VRNVRYWHLADIRGSATFCPLLDKSGQISGAENLIMMMGPTELPAPGLQGQRA
jgi:hypothetical protein